MRVLLIVAILVALAAPVAADIDLPSAENLNVAACAADAACVYVPPGQVCFPSLGICLNLG